MNNEEFSQEDKASQLRNVEEHSDGSNNSEVETSEYDDAKQFTCNMDEIVSQFIERTCFGRQFQPCRTRFDARPIV